MIGLVLWGWAALASDPAAPDPAAPDLEQLLEPEAAEAVEVAAAEAVPSPEPTLPFSATMPVFFVGLLLAGGWAARQQWIKQRALGSGTELRIVGRTFLGGTAGLAVIEVRDREGLWRRLVVGTGDGAPRLVADLGEPTFGLLPATPEAEPPSLHTHPDPRGREGAGPRFEHLVQPSSPMDPFGDPGLSPEARELIDEVLGERRTDEVAAPIPTSSFKTLA